MFVETLMSQVQRVGGTQIISTGGAAKPYLTIVTQAGGTQHIRPSTMTTSALGQPIATPGLQTDNLTQALEQAAESAETSIPMQVGENYQPKVNGGTAPWTRCVLCIFLILA